LAEAHPNGVSAEKICQHFLQNGLKGSIATIYRALRDLAEHELIFRDLKPDGRTAYRVRPDDYDEKSITVHVNGSGRTYSFVDKDLRFQLVHSLVREGLIDAEADVFSLSITVN